MIVHFPRRAQRLRQNTVQVVQRHANLLILVCLSDPPGEYQIIEDDGGTYARTRVFTTATSAGFAQQLANTRRRRVRVVSVVDPAFDDSAIYEPYEPPNRRIA